MVFEIKNKRKVASKREIRFKSEKELQNLCESNLEAILGLEFIATEYSVDQFRFDTVAYDGVNKCFVIIEYKNTKNDSVIDQGYSYLQALLNNKADFVLLYNDVKKS